MRSQAKIKDLDSLAQLVGEMQASGRKVVHCHGTFDPLHIGHIRHFEQAKRLGDVLIVTVTPDRFVNKGPQRPVFTEQLRAEAIAALACVDFVAINRWPMAVETIQLLRPNVFVKGSEFANRDSDRTGAISLEEEAVKAVGGEFALTYDLTFSASNLVNRHLQVLPAPTSEYLAGLGSRRTADEMISYLDGARGLRVLVVGETIIDDYHFCEAIGKSSKEPTLAVKVLSTEQYAGGILAVANTVSGFTETVGALTLVGDGPSRQEFIDQNIGPGIDTLFVRRSGAPTIVKRRFVEAYFFTKMLEVYEIDDSPLSAEDSQAVVEALRSRLPEYDVVIVVDFGHGMLGPEAIDLLTQKAKFLALNTQANAGNLGYNTLSRYPRADYVCMNEYEARLEARDRRGDLRGIVERLARRIGCRSMVVTRGKFGCLAFSAEDGFVEVPTLTSNVVDRVGAGDAFLSVTALCAAQGAPAEVLGFIGNAVGAQAVATVGHARPVERLPLYRQIECLLK